MGVLSVQLTVLFNSWNSIKTLLPNIVTLVTNLTSSFKENIIKLATAITTNKIFNKRKEDEAKSSLKAKQALDEESNALDRNTKSKIANKLADSASGDAGAAALGNTGGTVLSGATTSSLVAGAPGASGMAAATGATVSTAGAAAAPEVIGAVGTSSSAAAGGMASFGAALGTVAAVAAVAIVVLGALAAAIYFAVKAYNKDADAAKEAAKVAEEAAKTYENAKKAAADLRNEVSSYKDAVKATKELTAGTDEYVDSLKKANEEARNLIEKYELFDKYHYENGMIVIDEDALQAAQNKADNFELESRANMYVAQIGKNKADQRNQATNLSRKTASLFSYTTTDEEYGTTYTTGKA